jgi:RHS repeat-associated protein
LGRTTAVCEISGSTLLGVAPVNCGLDISGTGFLTQYAYNTDYSRSNAQEITVTQGAQTRYFETDFLGRTTLVVQPESGVTTYSYAYSSSPGYGLTVTRVRPEENQPVGSTNTVTTTTQYDSVGRVVSVNYSDGFTPSKGFSYDTNAYWAQTGTNLKGRLAVTGTGGTATWTGSLFSYDAMGRMVNIWQCAPATCGTGNQAARPLSFAYDWAGNLVQESDGVSGTIAYGRSTAGEVTSITNETFQDLPYDPPNLVSNLVNGPDGPVSYTLGNGLNVYRSYDQLGRYTQQWVCNGPPAVNCSGGTAIYGTASQWKGSQMQTQSDTVLNQGITFGYGDGFNRLTSRTVTSGTLQNYTYAYDRYGNRVSQTPLQGGYTFNPTINPANNQITTSGYTYDAAGNMLNDGVHSYQYDAEGNLVWVDGGSTAKYVYDVFNQRVHVQTASAITEYIYDYAGRRVSGWLSPNNYGNQGRIYWDGQQIGFRSSDGTNFDHQDILGTERLRTTYSGAVGATYQSLPWGDGYTATVNNSGADQDSLHFAGLEHDAESGTEHAQFRNYASAQGRWLAPDSYLGSYDLTNPQSMNRYAYTLNNPTSLLDPSGLTVTCTELNGSFYCIDDEGNNNTDCGSNYTACASATDCVAYGTEGCITADNPGTTTTVPNNPSNVGSSVGLVAPSNGPTWYKNPCVQSALAKGAGSTAIDAVGLLPEGGAVAGAFSLWHGAAGVSNGINILARVQFGAAIISTASAGSDASGDGAYSLAGAQLATGFASIGVGLAKAAPILGQALSAASVLEDLYGTYQAVAGCHP